MQKIESSHEYFKISFSVLKNDKLVFEELKEEEEKENLKVSDFGYLLHTF
jgi:hypothetical protein